MPATPVRRRVRPLVALAAVALLVLLGACGGSDDGGDDNGPVTTTTDRVATGATGPNQATTTPPVTTAAPPAPTGRPTAEEASQALYDAWVADDRAAAATVGDQPAIDNLWPAVKGNYGLYSACDSGEFDAGGCLYRDRGNNNTIQFDLEKRADQWVVANTFYSPGG